MFEIKKNNSFFFCTFAKIFIMRKATDWKQKAKDSTLANKYLKQRNKELFISRDDWKDAYFKLKAETEKQAKELVKIKKKLKELLR